MADFDLHELEDCIEELLVSHQRLRNENATLHNELENHIRRNVELKARIQQVLARVEALEQHQEMSEASEK